MRFLTAVSLAFLAVGCGVDAPTAPVTVLPKAGEPATIELSANPGVGPNGGTATITARVLDGVFTALPNTTVTFTANAGTLASQAVQTDDKGIATTTLTATPGTVKVSATAGAAHSTDTSVTIQPVNVFVPPPPGPVPPPEAPLPPIPPPTPPQPSYTVSVVALPTSVVTGTPTTLTATVTPLSGAPAVTSWVWDCDTTVASTDATTANTATCTYPVAGTFTASLRVTGGTVTGSATTSVTVTAAPVPSYTVTVAASPATIAAGGSSTLTATLTRLNGAPTPTSWAWDCDTNTPSTDFISPISATCTYPTAGIFPAKVTVSNGTVIATATTDVNVTNAAAPIIVAITPTAVAPATLATIHVGNSVNFTAAASSAAPPTTINWEWDDDNDGTFETLPTPAPTPNTRTVVMLVAGTWKVRVRVTDPATGRTASATSQVTVLP